MRGVLRGSHTDRLANQRRLLKRSACRQGKLFLQIRSGRFGPPEQGVSLSGEIDHVNGLNAAQRLVLLGRTATVLKRDRWVGQQPLGKIAIAQRPRDGAVDQSPQIAVANTWQSSYSVRKKIHSYRQSHLRCPRTRDMRPLRRSYQNQTERVQVRDHSLELGSHLVPHDIYTRK